ncbi:unnamed protein product [Rotaria sordida]|uniref:Uncharacterized protein n=1 Tax=Rotaria sordida TaxID=392033 RepID=A0A814UKM2_9BILA|nr:unnamed protein product [Rotaria sordida]CAF1173500.1 unnamed protein product [Rotaria sordida]
MTTYQVDNTMNLQYLSLFIIMNYYNTKTNQKKTYVHNDTNLIHLYTCSQSQRSSTTFKNTKEQINMKR